MAVPENIEKLAHQIRTEIYGRDVREAIASSVEATADVADWARHVAQQIIDGDFDEGALKTEIERKLNELEQEYAPKLNGLDTEITNARGNDATLGDRLNKTTAQLERNEETIKEIELDLSNKEQYIQYLENNKMDKNTNDISVSQINKNLGKLDQTYMKDEFLQQMAGNTPINSVPADGGVTNAKLANSAVNRIKMHNSFMGEPIFLDSSVDLNSFTKEGNYLATNALNKPPQVGDNSVLLKIRHFWSTAGYAQWCIQKAYNLSNPKMVYERKITLTGTPSNTDWEDVSGGTTNRFMDNKVVCFGDSITGAYQPPNDYPTRLKEYLDMYPYNVGFGGSRMGTHNLVGYDAFSMYRLADEIIKPNSDPTKWALQDEYVGTHVDFQTQLERLKSIDFSTVDYVVIFLGTNDFSGVLQLDNTDDLEDVTTYGGATRYSLKKIMRAFTQIKVLLIAPMFREVGTEGNSDFTPNNGGIYLREYVEKLIEVGREFKVPVLDLLHESGINRYNYNRWLYDGIHPNLDGRFMLGGKVASKLSSVY